MNGTLGANIAALRKSKGMTQEQLAAAVGVSTPAVSKWETEKSCPDITLLCPLARALGTNVDTLLQFEESLSDENITAYINEVLETARTRGVQPAETRLQSLLHEYPSSISLKYYASTMLIMFEVFYPESSEEKKRQWKNQRKELLQSVYADRTSAYWQSAVSELASLEISGDKLDEAEQLLNELPEHHVDPTMNWTQLYLKRGEAEKALEILQKRLYTLIMQVQMCLIQMMSEKLQPDAEKALEVYEVYHGVEELFACSGGMGVGLLAEIYLRLGQEEKAMESLLRMVDAAVDIMKMPKPLLFSHAVNTKTAQAAATVEMRKMLLKGLMTDESVAAFRENAEFQAAIEKLRKSIEADSSTILP